jgi:hypothetical protein
VFLYLYAITGNTTFEDRATQLATTLKNNLGTYGNAYIWDYGDPLLPTDSSEDQYVEDTSHANQEIAFAVLSYQMGIVFNSTDMQYFTNTLTGIMWNHSISSPQVAQYVDGSGGAAYTQYLGQWTALASVVPSASAYTVWSIVTAVFQQRHLWLSPHTNKGEEMLTVAHLIDMLPKDGQLLRNGNFENAGPRSSLPDGWVRIGSTVATAYLEGSEVATGQRGLAVLTRPAGGAQYAQQGLYYLPNAPITVTFSGHTNGSAAGGRMQVYDYTARKVLADIDFTNTTWQTFTATFNAPTAAGHNIQVRLTQIDWRIKGGATFFDDVTATQ